MGRTLGGEFATSEAEWPTRCAVLSPCASRTCIAQSQRVCQIATLPGRPNCPPRATTLEIISPSATELLSSECWWVKGTDSDVKYIYCPEDA